MIMRPYVDHIRVLALLVPLVVAAACRKEPPSLPDQRLPPISLAVEHHVGELPLAFDTMMYHNAAGHLYSVTRLEYYLSGLVLEGAQGTPDHHVPGPWYINGREENVFSMSTAPVGNYAGIRFQLGLPPALNQTNALPPLLENVNMAWPIPMGGGYHFMKFEGHFLHQGQPTGYAMHVGKDQHLVQCGIPAAFNVTGEQGTLRLHFHLDRVFDGTHVYDLPGGNQSMGSDSLMAVLRDNCMNAFSFEFVP